MKNNLACTVRELLTLGLLLILPLSGCQLADPGPSTVDIDEAQQDSIIPIPILFICDNIFSDAPCKNALAGTACAPPAGGKCTLVAPIGNGFYDCICALPPPPPPPPPPPDCVSADPCWQSYWDDGLQACTDIASPDGTPCDDGNPATEEDQCSGGICLGVTYCNCNDGTDCSSEVCDATPCTARNGFTYGTCRIITEVDTRVGEE